MKWWFRPRDSVTTALLGLNVISAVCTNAGDKILEIPTSIVFLREVRKGKFYKLWFSAKPLLTTTITKSLENFSLYLST